MPGPPFPVDSQIQSDKPLDEALMKDGFRDSDDWNWSVADDGGFGGIDANVAAFAAAFGPTGHSHDGTDGQGAKINTAGIANDAASLEPMFQDNCVSAAKIAANTLTGDKFEDMAVTGAKMSGTMGTHITGSQAYDTLGAPGTDDAVFQGDRVVIGGGSGVVCGQAVGADASGSGQVDWFPVRQGANTITLGFNFDPMIHAASGSWSWDFRRVP